MNKFIKNGHIDFDPLVDAYEREDRRREKDTRIQRETRRMNQGATNKKRGKAARKKS